MMNREEIELAFQGGETAWVKAINNGSNFDRLNRPQVGDLVLETTMGRLMTSSHIGFLDSINYTKLKK